MRVLVTGGGGFLGTAICRLLRERGDGVVSLARNRCPSGPRKTCKAARPAAVSTGDNPVV